MDSMICIAGAMGIRGPGFVGGGSGADGPSVCRLGTETDK